MTDDHLYDSLLDVPLDEQDPADDGDDRHVHPERFAASSTIVPRGRVASWSAMAVPFFALKRGSRGKPVQALNRALSRAGFRRWSWPYSPLFTIWVERSLKRFQRASGLPATGAYDRATHRALARYYDAYAIRYLLLAAKPKQSKDDKQRATFVAQLTYLYNRRSNIMYSQRRPFDCDRPPTSLDCSASGEWAGDESGLGSLSGYGSCGYGNTDTQIVRYRARGWIRDSIDDAKPGDPKYFGQGIDPSHVAYYIGKDKQGVHRVFTFGSYPAKITRHDYRHDAIAVCNLTGR